MIIFGTRGITYNKSHGTFFCPDCGCDRPYKLRRQRLFFTLYYIPLVPMNLLSEYVECKECESAYDPKILSLDFQEASLAQPGMTSFQELLLKVMLTAMLADGVIEESEEEKVRSMFVAYTGQTLGEEELEEGIDEISHHQFHLEMELLDAVQELTREERETLFKAALCVSVSDGEIHRSEIATLALIAKTLKLRGRRLEEALASSIETIQR